MPFTFARWLDPVVQAPVVQNNIVAALMTLGFAKPAKDASDGEMWRIMQRWGWITWKYQARDLIFVRRYALRHSARKRATVMWIGVQLNGQDYRIACDQVFGQERARLGRLLNFTGLSLGQCALGGDGLDFKARSIRISGWAGRRPPTAAAVASSPMSSGADITINYANTNGAPQNADAPPAPIGGIIYSNATLPAQQEELYFNEVAEDEIEINYT